LPPVDDVALLVIAKEPVAGRVKTRLTPPFSGEQAAELAAAALRDTLDAVSRAPSRRRVLVFDGDPTDWVPADWEVVPQRGRGLDERLAAAFQSAAGPSLLVGMDTPQLTPALLADGAVRLMAPGVDAVLGPACDGGYWSVGLRRPRTEVFVGVPMSRPETLRRQRARMRGLGIRVVDQPQLRDVDTAADAAAVAAQAPDGRFAAVLTKFTANAIAPASAPAMASA
jgi:rSAM/selenodomain-associated transferase 1